MSCTLFNDDFERKTAGDAYLQEDWKCRVCSKLAGEHPSRRAVPPASTAGQGESPQTNSARKRPRASQDDSGVAAVEFTTFPYVIDYSPKSVAVFGDTKPIKEKLKKLGGRFNMRLKYNGIQQAGWIFQQSQKAFIEKLLTSIKGSSSSSSSSSSGTGGDNVHSNDKAEYKSNADDDNEEEQSTRISVKRERVQEEEEEEEEDDDEEEEEEEEEL